MLDQLPLLRKSRQFQKALDEVHRLEAMGADSVQLKVDEADLLARLRRPRPALKLLQAAEERYGRLPTYGQALMAGLLEHLGHKEQADRLFDELAREPHELEAPVARRVVRNLLARDRSEQALELAHRTARSTPTELVWLARCALKAGQVAEAREELESALRLDPDHMPALEEWARLRLDSPRLMQEVLEVAAWMPGTEQTHLLERVAQALRHLSRPELALPLLEECARREPGNSYLLANLGYVHRQLGQLEMALVCLELAMEVDPSDPATFTAFLATCREAGQKSRAASYIQARVAGHPEERRRWGRFRKFFGRARGPAATPPVVSEETSATL